MRKRPLGELEIEILQYISNHAPCTVRDVAEGFGEPRGLARTTILTVMERLRAKGYLDRSKDQSANAYTPAHEKGEVLEALVKDFVEQTLGGSLSPFVAYLANSKGLTPGEVDDLKKLVDDLGDGDNNGS